MCPLAWYLKLPSLWLYSWSWTRPPPATHGTFPWTTRRSLSTKVGLLLGSCREMIRPRLWKKVFIASYRIYSHHVFGTEKSCPFTADVAGKFHHYLMLLAPMAKDVGRWGCGRDGWVGVWVDAADSVTSFYFVTLPSSVLVVGQAYSREQYLQMWRQLSILRIQVHA